ncbi:MAG: hypothetical protein AB7U79_00565 [Candidatus Izemoplasmatales bacterium]
MSKMMKFWIYLFTVPMMILIYYGVIIFIFTVTMGSAATFSAFVVPEDFFVFIGTSFYIAVGLIFILFLIMLLAVKNPYVQSTFFGFLLGLLINVGRIYLYPSNSTLFYIIAIGVFLFLAIVSRKKISLVYLYSLAFSSLLFYLYL